MEAPISLAINAWPGSAEGRRTPLGPAWKAWASTQHLLKADQLLKAVPIDLRNWRDPEVGWGLVLPDNEALSEADRATAVDAPQAIQDLVAARAPAPVLRYRSDPVNRILRRYYPDRRAQDLQIAGSARGTAQGRLPYYLLLYGSPKILPWDLQYALNMTSFVGRLDLSGEALENYVAALLREWPGAMCTPEHPVIWTVDHDKDDITHTMRYVLAEPLRNSFGRDNQIGSNIRYLAGPEATASKLAEALSQKKPALVVTTSHGMTGPLDDSATMAKNLGLLVDQDYQTLQPDHLLQQWDPNGTIWYAHACCSAGSDSKTNYVGLVPEDSQVDRILKGVASLGAQSAPFPRALLGAGKPLRAFIGHVEPTFDWTVRQPETGQPLTATLTGALYNNMHQGRPEPVAMAFRDFYHHAGALFAQWSQAVRAVNNGEATARATALACQLAALDRQSLVILGDPTACIPALP